MTTQLVLDALEQAIWTRQRSDQSVEHVVAHSDRGSQYTSIRYTERLAEAGIAASVGSVGDSYDNALAEAVNSLVQGRSDPSPRTLAHHRCRRVRHRRVDRLVQPPPPARVLRRHPTSRARGRVLRSTPSPATRRAHRLRQSPDMPGGFTLGSPLEKSPDIPGGFTGGFRPCRGLVFRALRARRGDGKFRRVGGCIAVRQRWFPRQLWTCLRWCGMLSACVPVHPDPSMVPCEVPPVQRTVGPACSE